MFNLVPGHPAPQLRGSFISCLRRKRIRGSDLPPAALHCLVLVTEERCPGGGTSWRKDVLEVVRETWGWRMSAEGTMGVGRGGGWSVFLCSGERGACTYSAGGPHSPASGAGPSCSCAEWFPHLGGTVLGEKGTSPRAQSLQHSLSSEGDRSSPHLCGRRQDGLSHRSVAATGRREPRWPSYRSLGLILSKHTPGSLPLPSAGGIAGDCAWPHLEPSGPTGTHRAGGWATSPAPGGL